MKSAHAALFFVLLLLPNTTLTDWQRLPHLRGLLAGGCVALMNARTAEHDTITPLAGAYSLMAGARMGPSESSANLGYPARADNLPAALASAGVFVRGVGLPIPPNPPSLQVGGRNELAETYPPSTWRGEGAEGREVIIITLGSDPVKADAQIGAWAAKVTQQGGELMVVSPNPSPAEYAAYDQLTPVLLYGPSVPQGTLFSPSTHQRGLITNTDIAPTIAAAFGARLPTPAFGAPLSTIPMPGANRTGELLRKDQLWQREERARRAVPYLAGLIALFLAVATAYGLATHRSLGGAAVFVVAIPLALLLASTLWLLALLLLMAAAYAYLWRQRPWHGIVRIAAATALLVAGDAICAAGAVTAHSLLGYSPMEGARYYGIGNEAMGALVGSLAIVTGALYRRGWKLAGAAAWLVAAFALGWPGAGAKAGGFFVALISLATFAWAAWGRRQARPLSVALRIVGILAGVIFAGFLLAFAGRWVGGRTHVGLALQLFRSQGGVALWSIIVRKAAMDIHLLFHSVWALVLVVAGWGAALLHRRRAPAWEGDRVTLATVIAAAAASLAMNDAGVVAAAICLVFLWAYSACAPAALSPTDPV